MLYVKTNNYPHTWLSTNTSLNFIIYLQFKTPISIRRTCLLIQQIIKMYWLKNQKNQYMCMMSVYIRHKLVLNSCWVLVLDKVQCYDLMDQRISHDANLVWLTSIFFLWLNIFILYREFILQVFCSRICNDWLFCLLIYYLLRGKFKIKK